MTTETNTERLEAVLEDARHCAALTSVIRENLGGESVARREIDLVRLSQALAGRIFDYFWLEVPAATGPDSSAATGTAGKLRAVIEVILDADARAALVVCAAERDKLVERIGWLQNAAHDLAEELVGLLEEIRAKEVV